METENQMHEVKERYKSRFCCCSHAEQVFCRIPSHTQVFEPCYQSGSLPFEVNSSIIMCDDSPTPVRAHMTNEWNVFSEHAFEHLKL